MLHRVMPLARQRLCYRWSQRYLSALAKSSLGTLKQRVADKLFGDSFSKLNHLHDDEMLTTMMAAVDKTSKKVDVGLADYINPTQQTLPALIAAIEAKRYPKQILQLLNHKSPQALVDELCTKVLFQKYVESTIYSTPPLDALVDISDPAEWFPQARKMRRKFIMHVGPTNSGKTYHSLQRLARAQLGYYAGPLRLLAREIYERFNQEGVVCNLITGEEVIPMMDTYGNALEISLGTIEMIPLYKKMDMCVIDEIQMLGDPNRGAAWTAAVLGVQAKEIHLCGEESAVPIVERLIKTTGDDLEIKRFSRLGKLTVQPKPMTNYKQLVPGDCVIAFSKRKILDIKLKIEQQTRLKVGVIYGALPPEIRSHEANAFNSGKYDVLVATDAIGMGLNLRIRRIVFQAISKFDGNEVVPLTPSSIKQIAGRAGRFSRIAGELEGFVTALTSRDLMFVRRMMERPNKDIEKAVIWPVPQVWKQYIAKFSGDTSFYEILSKFKTEVASTMSPLYTMSALDPRLEILKLFLRSNLFQRITIEDQLTLSLAPILGHLKMYLNTVHKFLLVIANNSTCNVFMLQFLLRDLLLLTLRVPNDIEAAIEGLTQLEENHKLVLLFLWLSQRWPSLFVDKELAMEIKSLIEKRISQELEMIRRSNKGKKYAFRRPLESVHRKH